MTYLLAYKWFDVGAGCCSDRKNYKLFAGSVDDLDACKNKCLENEKCKYVEYGWKNSRWCFLVSSDASCPSLKSGKTPDCGSGGDTGVHVYEYRQGMCKFY